MTPGEADVQHDGLYHTLSILSAMIVMQPSQVFVLFHQIDGVA
jgi:hypothetical protein